MPDEQGNVGNPSTRQSARKPHDANLAYFARRPDQIDERLKELDAEWDIARTIQVRGGIVSLVGLALGATFGRRWLIIPALATGFIVEHALQGWAPPVPLLRRLGYRTLAEIDRERYALKALRGDFKQTSAASKRGNPDSIAAKAFEATA